MIDLCVNMCVCSLSGRCDSLVLHYNSIIIAIPRPNVARPFQLMEQARRPRSWGGSFVSILPLVLGPIAHTASRAEDIIHSQIPNLTSKANQICMMND
jgi:hypothetical protein